MGQHARPHGIKQQHRRDRGEWQCHPLLDGVQLGINRPQADRTTQVLAQVDLALAQTQPIRRQLADGRPDIGKEALSGMPQLKVD